MSQPPLPTPNRARWMALIWLGFALTACPTEQLTAPSTPLSFSTTPISASTVNLSWSASSGATSYRLERAVGRVGFNKLSDQTALLYSDTGLTVKTLYTYRLTAFNATGPSASAEVSVTTLDPTSLPPAAPNITGFTPATGAIGSSVTLTGANFVTVSSVKFGAVSSSFTVLNSTSLTAVVPVGAITAKIIVSTPSGAVTSSQVFTVTSAVPPPPPSPPTPPSPAPPSPSGVTPNPVPTQQTWMFCSNPYQGCTFEGLRDVRIGSGSSWVVKEFFGGVHCRSESFDVSAPNGEGGNTCEVSTFVKTGTLAPSVNPMGPTVNLTRVPLGSSGSGEMRIKQTSSDSSEQPTQHNDTTSGEFRTHCDFSHMSFDDPIVYPGQPGRSHLHTFFGNTRTSASSTALSIAETGNSTCAGGIANRTAYWVPTVIDTKDGTPLAPEDSIWYYKNGSSGIPKASFKPMPRGLRMIAGNASASGAAMSDHASWSCWETGGQGGQSIPTGCPVGDFIVMNVTFPQCWNGKDLDSSDHKSHMSYALPTTGLCPASHPVVIPEISLNLKYKVHDASAAARWRLSSDMYPTSQSGGYSAHADWFDGWNEDIKNTWVSRCNVAGFDCHAFLLGDGRLLY